MYYTISARLFATTSIKELLIPLNYASKLKNIFITSTDAANLVVSFNDNNIMSNVQFADTDDYIINDQPNTFILHYRQDSDATPTFNFNVNNYNVNIEDILKISYLGSGSATYYLTLELEMLVEPEDVKNTLVRDLAEAVTQVADGENLISAGEVFFQKRIRGLKQVGQGDFAV